MIIVQTPLRVSFLGGGTDFEEFYHQYARARSELGWRPMFPGIDGIIESAWRWLRDHPDGYER